MGVMKERCKVAIVGAGNMAKEHIRAFAALPNVDLVGIYSRTKSKAAELAALHKIPVVVDSLEELFNETHADLVVVTVYETSMLEVALKCMYYPWSIFLEKPPGYNLDQALQIENTANKNNSTVLVGLNRRFLSSSQCVLNSLNNLDSPRFINVFDQQSLALARSLNHSTEVVDNWMYANSIHLIDYITFLCRGDVQDVYLDKEWVPDIPMVVNGIIKFSSGDQAVYQGVWEMPGPWAVTAITDKIRWEMRPLEKAVFQMAGERVLNPVDIDLKDQEFKPGFVLQAEQAILKILGKPSSSPTISDAIKTMRIINKMYNR